VRTVVAAQHDVVEHVVVAAGQRAGPFGIVPDPFAEPFADFAGLLLGGDGLGQIGYAAAVVELIEDAYLALFEQGVGDVDRR
jgi:hypothetical protein